MANHAICDDRRRTGRISLPQGSLHRCRCGQDPGQGQPVVRRWADARSADAAECAAFGWFRHARHGGDGGLADGSARQPCGASGGVYRPGRAWSGGGRDSRWGAGLRLRPITRTDLPADLLADYRASAIPSPSPAPPPCPAASIWARNCTGWISRDPEGFAGATLMPYAQYWAWLLSGAAVSEVTSLGCHSDLWNPAEARFSPLAERRGWAAQFAPLVKAGDVVGTLCARRSPPAPACRRDVQSARGPARFQRRAAGGARLCRSGRQRERRCFRPAPGSSRCARAISAPPLQGRGRGWGLSG